MTTEATSCALARDILEWYVPDEVLSVLLKDRSTGRNLIWATDDYAERERMNSGDNPPVGIVLGSGRNETVIRYTLNEHERNLFAVKYHLNLPTEEELQREHQRERAAFEEARLLAAPQKVTRAWRRRR